MPEALGYSSASAMYKLICNINCKDITASNFSDFKIFEVGNSQITKLKLVNEIGLKEAVQKNTICTQEFKNKFLTCLNKNDYINNNFILTSRKEIEFVDSLLKVLEPFNFDIEKQKVILKYKIDFYIKDLNIGIEYDENNHSDYDSDKEEYREKAIKESLGCKIIRVSDRDSDLWNIGFVFKEIISHYEDIR